jgi:flagellar biogenesis protein FliO
MEIFGGFMVMMSIIGLFLAVVWLIMPFVVFAIKGRQDRSLEILEVIEKRLSTMEQQLLVLQAQQETHPSLSVPAEDNADQTSRAPLLPLA